MLFNDLESMEMRHTSLVMSKQQSCQDLFTLFGMSRLTFPKARWTSQRKLKLPGAILAAKNPYHHVITTTVARGIKPQLAQKKRLCNSRTWFCCRLLSNHFVPNTGAIIGARAIIKKKVTSLSVWWAESLFLNTTEEIKGVGSCWASC